MCNSIIATMLDVVPHLDSDLHSKLHAIQLSYELSYTCSEIAAWMSILLRVGHIYPAGNPYGAQCPAGEWLDKLQRYTQASELVIRPNPKKASEPEVAMQAEGERVLRALSPQVQ